uniref:IST1 homolog n=1 Tax=Xenopus tropicalis TaxID=8364 RepID=A0A803JFF1_XENTR
MLGSGFKAERLRVNLRLAINRLKLLEKKKTEMALKARKEIADYLSCRKDERARIRVEHIIREDYLVEAMEILELYCDLLLARFGLIQSMRELDPGLAEAVSTLIWAAPRLQSEVSELKIVASQLCHKYSKEYGNLCRTNQIGTVSDKLMNKLGTAAPPKILVEKYLIEIAKNYKVPYEPDAVIMGEAPTFSEVDPSIIGFVNDDKKGGPGNGGGFGGGDFRINQVYPNPNDPVSLLMNSQIPFSSGRKQNKDIIGNEHRGLCEVSIYVCRTRNLNRFLASLKYFPVGLVSSNLGLSNWMTLSWIWFQPLRLVHYMASLGPNCSNYTT